MLVVNTRDAIQYIHGGYSLDDNDLVRIENDTFFLYSVFASIHRQVAIHRAYVVHMCLYRHVSYDMYVAGRSWGVYRGIRLRIQDVSSLPSR